MDNTIRRFEDVGHALINEMQADREELQASIERDVLNVASDLVKCLGDKEEPRPCSISTHQDALRNWHQHHDNWDTKLTQFANSLGVSWGSGASGQ